MYNYDDQYGRGVYATETIQPNVYICEYKGRLLSKAKATQLEQKYEQNNKGSYIFFFTYGGRDFATDATEEPATIEYGRLINHSFHANVTPAKCLTDIINLYSYSNQVINSGDQLSFDYADRRAEVMEALPWLNTNQPPPPFPNIPPIALVQEDLDALELLLWSTQKKWFQTLRGLL